MGRVDMSTQLSLWQRVVSITHLLARRLLLWGQNWPQLPNGVGVCRFRRKQATARGGSAAGSRRVRW